jgi:hypothetical protein
MESNPKAVRGYSRDRRPDCKQVTVRGATEKVSFLTRHMATCRG